MLALSVSPAFAPPGAPTLIGRLITDGGPEGAELQVGDVRLSPIMRTDEPDIRYPVFIIQAYDPTYTITAVQIDVQTNPANFPQKNGNPQSGKFTINVKGLDTNYYSSPTYVLHVHGALDQPFTIYVAIHVTLYNTETLASVGAWARAAGPILNIGTYYFSGNSWATAIRLPLNAVY